MTGFEIRPAGPMDAGAVGAILSGFIDTTEWMPRIHTRAEDLAHADMLIQRGWVTVATRNRKVCGFLARNGGVVHALYVHPTARSTGVGAMLLNDAKLASPALELWTFEANRGAQRFYEREGFELAEQTDGKGNDEGLPDRRYVWSATSAEAAKQTERTA
ncbi:GNAT family N-acetyltransferase [Thalassococcus lentus]|uniref:GNAT family N-acetyltransferase n=1 Tax=Thalassococcus lentus TaxID=1210524 RepID=A0ABT4XW61_9RHOB|nr:GNAT family N-acetyltransferase [Thalassococcus lentus]MDA7426187.1 GNAT family N-acetyltransferase [Thalassococcus lentus]